MARAPTLRETAGDSAGVKKNKQKIRKLSNLLNMLHKVSRCFVHDKHEVSLHSWRTFCKKTLSDHIFPMCTRLKGKQKQKGKHCAIY